MKVLLQCIKSETISDIKKKKNLWLPKGKGKDGGEGTD